MSRLRPLWCWPCPFVTWLSEFPAIWAFVLLPWLVGTGLVGDALGLPLLFRNDDVLPQVVTGAMLGLVLAHLAYIGWLLARGVGVGPDDLYERATYPLYVLPVLGILYTVGFALADPHGRTARLLTAMWAAIFACLGAWRSDRFAALEARVAGKLRRVRDQGLAWLGAGPRRRAVLELAGKIARWFGPDAEPLATRVTENDAHGVAAVHVLGFVFAYVLVHLLSAWLPAAAAICVLLALVAGVWGWVRYFARRRFVAYAVGLVGAAVVQIVWLEPRHTLDGLADAPVVRLESIYPPGEADSAPLASAAAGLLDDAATLRAWREQVSGSPRLVVVATSGGGIRAAAWTAHVLQTLEKTVRDFPGHVRLVTGASGGMVGASYWVTTRSPVLDPRCAGKEAPTADLVADLAADSLDPVASHFALVRGIDRGRELERAWEKNTAGCFAVPFAALAIGEAAGTRPSLVFSPAVVEDGRRMLASHLDLGHLTRANSAGTSRSAYEMLRLFPGAPLRVSELARVSATFPYVSPEVRLPTAPVLRLVDAGYYDNYGVNLAARWIAHHAASEWLEGNVDGVLLLQIRDGPSRRDACPTGEAGLLARALSPWTAPIETVFAARTSTAEYRNDEQVAALERQFADRPGFFLTIELELPGDVPLSWRLTAEEIERVRAGLPEPDGQGGHVCPRTDDLQTSCERNRAELERLLEWWR